MVISKGIDCATTLTQAVIQAFKSDGVTFAGRYVKSNSWKTLKKAEADMLQACGIQILSVYERSADTTRGGAAAGSADGVEAFTHARAIGQPLGTAIYFAVDYDAPVEDFPRIERYLRAAAACIPGYKLGVYGKYSVIEAMAQGLPGIYCWQTRAWSMGKVSRYSHVYQKEIDRQIHGIGVDLNDLLKPDAGLWPKPEVKEEKPKMKKEDAEKVASILSKNWFLLQTAGADKSVLNEIGRLADEVRVAGGIPKQNG